MQEAIAAARRAFDSTGLVHEPKTSRGRYLMQLHDALQEEKEDIRAEKVVAEVGSTVGMTYIAQMEWPLADAIRYPAELISTFQWERESAEDAKMGAPYNRVVVKEAMGVVGAITPWNFPFEIISNKVRGARPGHRQHDGALKLAHLRRRGARCDGGTGSSPRRPTSRPVSSTSSASDNATPLGPAARQPTRGLT